MIMNLLTLFLCINVGLSLLSLPGTPFYVNGTDNCYFPTSGAPTVDPFTTVPSGLIGNQTANATNVQNEFITSTNSTLTEPGWLNGDPLNNFLDTVDQAAKSMELMKNIIGGGYIFNVVDHFSFSCSFNANGTLVAGPVDNPVWDTLKTGVSYIIFALTVFTLFYWITGRGHILTS